MTTLSTNAILLRQLRKEDLTEEYVSWLNDPNVNQYLETRYLPQTHESLVDYWNNHRDDSSSPWFAIVSKNNNKHIGNIKLGPINRIHLTADISLFIGDKHSWGKGYATQSIKLLSEWSFATLNIRKLKAGIYSENHGSRKAFEKAGFALEATLKEEVFFRGRYIDVWRMSLLRR